MSDDQTGTSAEGEDRAQSREELIHLLVENEDWAGLDAMTTHLSNAEEESSSDEAGALAIQLLSSISEAQNGAHFSFTSFTHTLCSFTSFTFLE